MFVSRNNGRQAIKQLHEINNGYNLTTVPIDIVVRINYYKYKTYPVSKYCLRMDISRVYYNMKIVHVQILPSIWWWSNLHILFIYILIYVHISTHVKKSQLAYQLLIFQTFLDLYYSKLWLNIYTTKNCSRWVPIMLMDSHKMKCMVAALEFL